MFLETLSKVPEDIIVGGSPRLPLPGNITSILFLVAISELRPAAVRRRDRAW
jgi:hypothetical protein